MSIFLIICLAIFGRINCESKDLEETSTQVLCGNDDIKSIIDKLFKKILEEIKEVLKDGSEAFGIPSMDPYKTGPINGSLNLDDINGDMSADNIAVSNLSNYNVTKATIKRPVIEMGFDWDQVEGNITKYNITRGHFMNFVSVFGNGNAVFTLENLSFSAEITFQLKNGKISVKTVESQVHLGGLKFFTEGLYDNSFISREMCAVISEMGPEFIKIYQKDLTSVINKRITDIVDKFLKHIPYIKDLLNKIFESVS